MGIYAKKGEGIMRYTTMASPVGELLLLSDGSSLTGVYMTRDPDPSWQREDALPVFAPVREWLRDYFEGIPRPVEDLPLKAEGTAFQKTVWEILRTIPWGQKRTYGDIAKEVACLRGKEKMSAQAVGQAVGKNPISILIPCHRCVGTGGKLTGYAGGIENKAWLLSHEEERK